MHEDLIFTLEEVAQCFKFILCGCRSGSMSWSYPIDIIYCAHYEPTHSGNKRPAAIQSGLFKSLVYWTRRWANLRLSQHS